MYSRVFLELKKFWNWRPIIFDIAKYLFISFKEIFVNALNLFIVFFVRIAVKIKINKRRLKKKTECRLQIFLIFSFIDVFSSKIASSIRSRNLRLPETWIFSFKFDKCKYCLSISIVQESLYNRLFIGKIFIMYQISRQFASVLISFNYF